MLRDRPQGDKNQDRATRRGGATFLQILAALIIGGLLMLVAVGFVARSVIGSLTPPTINLPFVGPTATPKIVTSSAIIEEIQQLNRLETSAYSIQTVVTAERPGGIAGIGRQKVLIIVHGTVTAGIDLSKLKPEDVTVSPDGKRVRVKLPPAEILSDSLDQNQTEIYDFQTGLFTRPDTSLITEAERTGAGKILQAACDDGIMKRATDEGQRSVGQMLRIFGFEAVDFDATTIPNCPVPPT